MTETAVRLGGLILIAGAALLGAAIVRVAFYQVVTEPFTPGVGLAFLLASILLLVSLPSLHARQAEAAGWLGLGAEFSYNFLFSEQFVPTGMGATNDTNMWNVAFSAILYL